VAKAVCGECGAELADLGNKVKFLRCPLCGNKRIRTE
jgi:predicted RNA-binding Zn-ribbon protein involved in translation (DUF1610 family)